MESLKKHSTWGQRTNRYDIVAPLDDSLQAELSQPWPTRGERVFPFFAQEGAPDKAKACHFGRSQTRA